MGSSYLPSELQAAFLWGQLEKVHEINNNRLETWQTYNDKFKELEQACLLGLPTIPEACKHNAHMFYLKLDCIEQRTAFIEHLKEQGITAVFHYIPLHTAPAGKKFGKFVGEDVFTTKESERLVRLPLYYGMTSDDKKVVTDAVTGFAW
jgi:dTDP-4-amino-4,6-dideoxygalactose transaminase